METELSAVNPKYMWDKAFHEHIHKVAQPAPKSPRPNTGRERRHRPRRPLLIDGLPPGNYWVTSLGMDAVAGDRHFLWDAPVTIQPGKTIQLELSNLNGIDIKAARP